MSVSQRLIKSLKKHGHSLTSNLHQEIPLALTRHIGPQIQELFAAQWFQTARDYFTNPPEIHILSIETKDIELLDILSELRNYLLSDPVLLQGPEFGSTPKNDKYFSKIRGILNKIDTRRITRIQRRALRKYIEINPRGRLLLKGFYEQIVSQGKIAPDMELIFNPYTSLVNLAEIYAQCSEYSVVRYSVPELGIQESRIHLYYPAKNRDEYLAQQIGDDIPHEHNMQQAWLPDALKRICFFNRLLGTKKQPRAIHVFLADFCKEFMHVNGKADLIFTPSEINTGVCDMTDIIITRSEESLKTLLHELIHFHSLDFKHATHDEFCAGLFNITTEQSSFNLFEAHTECLASILHCLTRAIPSQHPVHTAQSSNDKEFRSNFRRIFAAQIYYTMRKSAQILATSGCDSYEEFITPSDREKCQLSENTNVFSYFFVKAFIYLGLQDWLAGCCDPSTARFIDKTNGPQNGQDMLKQIIQSGYQNRILQKIINAEINLAQHRSLQEHKRSAKKTQVAPVALAADNSLKMVCVS